MRKLLLLFEIMNKKNILPHVLELAEGEVQDMTIISSFFLPFRESRRCSDPLLPRDCSKILRLHPWRLDSEHLRLLHRWGKTNSILTTHEEGVVERYGICTYCRCKYQKNLRVKRQMYCSHLACQRARKRRWQR